MIGIVVISYAEGEEVAKCIKAALSQTIPDEVRIVVVNNNSRMPTLRHIVPWVPKGIQVIGLPTNIGKIRAAHLAFRYLELQGEYTHFMSIDTDILIEPDVAEKLRELMVANPQIGLLNPTFILGKAGDHANHAKDLMSWRGKAKELPTDIPLFRRITSRVCEACFMISNDCYQALKDKHQGIYMTTHSDGKYCLSGQHDNQFMMFIEPLGFQMGYHKDTYVLCAKTQDSYNYEYIQWKRDNRKDHSGIVKPGEGFYDN